VKAASEVESVWMRTSPGVDSIRVVTSEWLRFAWGCGLAIHYIWRGPCELGGGDCILSFMYYCSIVTMYMYL
jgi:hypothetical protein